jgi:hypothetical protein
MHFRLINYPTPVAPSGITVIRPAVCFALLIGLLNECASAQASMLGRSPSSDNSLLVYAINLIHNRPLHEPVMGHGMYLGNGAAITAAHVISRWPGFISNPRVIIAGQELSAKIIKKGSPEATDLALLSVEESELPMRLRLRLNPLCREPARAGENVIVVAVNETARTQIMFPQSLPPEYRKNFNTFIRDVGVGASGSGVFHADKKCLLGIITTRTSLPGYRIEAGRIVRDLGGLDIKHFVPAATIVQFLPPEFRF